MSFASSTSGSDCIQFQRRERLVSRPASRHNNNGTGPEILAGGICACSGTWEEAVSVRNFEDAARWSENHQKQSDGTKCDFSVYLIGLNSGKADQSPECYGNATGNVLSQMEKFLEDRGLGPWDDALMDAVSFNQFLGPPKIASQESELGSPRKYGLKYLDLWTIWWIFDPCDSSTIIIMDVVIADMWFVVKELRDMVEGFCRVQSMSDPMLVGLFAISICKNRIKHLVDTNADNLFDAMIQNGLSMKFRFPDTALFGNGPRSTHAISSARRTFRRDENHTDLIATTNDVMASTIMMSRYQAVAKTMIDILAHLLSENQRHYTLDGQFIHRNTQTISNYITQTARVLSLEVSGISHVAESWKEKGSSLMQGLHNIIAQRNQSINLDVAKANWLDTAALTTMNLIAVIFLPATFFAALFQTSFFTNLLDGMPAYQQIMIYAVVSTTVTVSIIAAWLKWTRMVRRRRSLLFEGKNAALYSQ